MVTKVTPAHKEVANYFISYLFPIIAGSEFFSNIYLVTFFYVSIFFWIAFSGAYTFNPIFAFLGYKFYEAERDINIDFILITKTTLQDVSKPMKLIKLTEHTYLNIDTEDV